MRRIVDVFVKDRLRGSYPVEIEGLIDPSDDDFIDCVRTRLDRGAYSADDIQAARFVIREASSGSQMKGRSDRDDWWEEFSSHRSSLPFLPRAND